MDAPQLFMIRFVPETEESEYPTAPTQHDSAALMELGSHEQNGTENAQQYDTTTNGRRNGQNTGDGDGMEIEDDSETINA